MLCGYAISNIHSVAATERPLVIKSEVIPTSDVSLIRSQMTGLNPQNTIFFVDCDAVAFEHYISGEMPEPFLHKTVEELRHRGITGKKYEDTLAAFLSAQKHPVDPELNRLIRELQDGGAIVVFLTSCPAGRSGPIPSFAKLREKDLTDCGVPPQNWEGVTTLFDELHETRTRSIVSTDDTASVFVNGICFNVFSTKGKVMEAFLNRVKGDPVFDTIISQPGSFANNLRSFRSLLQSGRQNELTVFFIDDSVKNIHDVSGACGIYGTNYLGIQYTAQLERSLFTALTSLNSFSRGLLKLLHGQHLGGIQLEVLVGQGIFLAPPDACFLDSLTTDPVTIWSQLMFSSLFCSYLGSGPRSLIGFGI